MAGKMKEIHKAVIGFIISYYRENLLYPNYDEISMGVNRAKSTIYTCMERLEAEGIIVRKNNNSPQYRLINMGYILAHGVKENE